jgi:hypothetical protein
MTSTTTEAPSPAKLTPARAFAEHRRREAAWAAAERAVSKLSREFSQKLARTRELEEQRRRAINADPSLVNHRDEPISKRNSIAAIDRELEAVGDLAEFNAKVEHAKRLATSAKRACADYAAEHYEP